MRSILLKNILYTILFSFVIGIIKVEFFLSYLDVSIISNARVMSYITLIIGSVFYYFIILILVFMSYLIIEFLEIGRGVKISNFYKSINFYIFFLFFNEISKFIITISCFNSNVIFSIEDYNVSIEKNILWRQLIDYSDTIFIISGSIFYLVYFLKIDSTIKSIHVIYSSIPLFCSFLLKHLFE